MTGRTPEVMTRGLDEKQKKEMFYAISSSVLAEKLREFLDQQIRELKVSRSDYDNPAWAYKQAHYNGELQAYTKILNLLRPKAE